MRKLPFRNIPRTVVILGFVSLLTDSSSEMIYPLLPVFLSQTLGASAIALGTIEGLAEATAAILKLFSGIWADKVRFKKPFLVSGYGLAGLVRPLVGLAQSWPMVLGIRVTDRIGKGIRSAPRDALIADVTPPHQRGASFGFHRSMDHAGAVIGPLIATLLLGLGLSLRHVFLFAAIPAALTLIVLIFTLKETPSATPAQSEAKLPLTSVAALTPKLRWLLFSILVFTLGNSSDAFLLLRLNDAGISAGAVATLWAAHHVVKMICTYGGGKLSDRIGRKALILSGWFFYALVYLGFGWIHGSTAMIAIFLAYGIYYGLTEPVEKAFVADLATENLRGAAYGYYNFVIGVGALPASLIFGWIWSRFGHEAAFTAGAAFAVLASFLLLLIPSGEPTARRGEPA